MSLPLMGTTRQGSFVVSGKTQWRFGGWTREAER